MEPTWIVELTNGDKVSVTGIQTGVANDGSLLVFSGGPMGQQPQAIRGWAPGQWISFSKSNMVTN